MPSHLDQPRPAPALPRQPIARIVFTAATTISAVACGAESAPLGSWAADPFCQEVRPQVEAFLEGAASTSLVQDGARYGGVAVIGGIGEMATGMNVAAATDYLAVQHQRFVNLMTLLDYDEDLEPRPYLAESWEMSDDGTELTFRIRDDVVWHDGEPTDAHDVAFTYLRLTDPATEFPNAGFWDLYVRGEAGVEVLDDHTVKIRLEPHADFLDPWRAVAILPEHLLGDVPPEELRGHPYGTLCPVGNGPFVFLEHQDQSLWRFGANPTFPAGLGGRPFLDEYIYRVIPDENTLLLELLSGGVDVFIAAQPDHVDAIREGDGVRLLAYPFRNVTFAAWNSRRPQLTDARVRRALTLAVDRQEVVDALLQGLGSIAHGTVPPWHWASEPQAGAVPFDPAQARRLLDQAGWVDRDGDGVRENAAGLPLSISLKSNQGNRRLQRLALALSDQLRDVGVEVRPEVVEWSTLVSQITDPVSRDFDGVLLSWVTEFRLDDSDLFLSDRADQPYGFAGTADAELDTLLRTLPAIADRDEAVDLWRRYQERLAEVQPFTFFYFPDRIDGVSERLQDVVMDARGEWVNIREWWIAPEDRR